MMTLSVRLRAYGFRAAVGCLVEMIIALVGLALTLPIILLIAIAICLDTPGPVFYSQMRIGRSGRRFRIYKFRKFGEWAEASTQAVTLKNDPRMTRIGRLLERSKLDELPQLWNVLIGDMSFVGPRPETVEFADCFVGPVRNVLDYTPGLFGPNQVIFRNEASLYPENQEPHEFYRSVLFPAKARIDLLYFPQRTLLSDIVWIIRGILGLSPCRAEALKDIPEMEPWLRRQAGDSQAAAIVLPEQN